jgi:AcrR family transcriptional regulator
VDRAILAAAARLLREHGYSGMSVDAVAAEAGVGKAAIYRRYRDKADLAVAALVALREIGEVPDSGDTRKDLAELARRLRRAFDGVGMTMIGTLLAEERRNPELMERFRERAIGAGAGRSDPRAREGRGATGRRPRPGARHAGRLVHRAPHGRPARWARLGRSRGGRRRAERRRLSASGIMRRPRPVLRP